MKRLTTKEFIDRSVDIHEGKYSYDNVNYLNNKSKVSITCPIHGDFMQRPYRHIFGDGCPECGIVSSSKSRSLSLCDFINKSIEVHGDLYDYSKCKYINSSSKVTIKCSVHGDFEQIPSHHMSGHGCPSCNPFINNMGYGLSGWIDSAKYSKNFDSFKLYIVKCWKNSEEFFKIGRTYCTIENRFNGIPYHFKIIKVISGNPIEIFKLENKLKNEHKDFSYIPELNFSGMYECFSKVNL